MTVAAYLLVVAVSLVVMAWLAGRPHRPDRLSDRQRERQA